MKHNRMVNSPLLFIPTRSLSNIALVTRESSCGQMSIAQGPGKLEAYSLEYVEEFFGLRTLQMVADRSPQQNGPGS